MYIEIKRPKWSKKVDLSFTEYRAKVNRGSLFVRQTVDMGIFWGYEFGDESDCFPCTSVMEGKVLACTFYREYLSSFLKGMTVKKKELMDDNDLSKAVLYYDKELDIPGVPKCPFPTVDSKGKVYCACMGRCSGCSIWKRDQVKEDS